jgi:leucine dehydrogenase
MSATRGMSATGRALPTVAQGAGSTAGFDHELLLVRRGPRSGAHVITAVHSTVLGPALGGCRLWRYEDLDAAIADALRLAGAMTLKAAAAGLAVGGGKSVIFPPPQLRLDGAARGALLADFAESLQLLNGIYITAEDVGTTPEDMAVLSRFSRHVVGAPARNGGSGDPGRFTATGVYAALRACARHCFGSPQLGGRSVAIVGVGHVGEPLARRLAAADASLVLADVDPAKRALARELGAHWMSPEQALRAEVDVICPCALGGAIDEELCGELQARVICGSANNQLAEERLARLLAERGVLYAPDFIVNAGGLISVAGEVERRDREQVRAAVAEIEGALARILARAGQAGVTPLAVAHALACERLERARVLTAGHPGGRIARWSTTPSPASAAARQR